MTRAQATPKATAAGITPPSTTLPHPAAPDTSSDTTPTRTAVNSRLGPAGAAVALAGLGVNALAYAVPLLGARTLSATELGALAAVLALGAIAAVPAQGLQAALAVRWARHGHVPNAGRATLLTAGTTAAVVGAAVPLISITLHVPSALPVALAVTSVAVVLSGRWLGELQGTQRFGRLGAGMVMLAVGRYGGVIAGLAASAGVAGALWWGAAVAWLMLPILALISRTSRVSRTTVPTATTVSSLTTDAGPTTDAGLTTEPVRGRDIAAASGATLAMLAASYADLVLARHYLTGAESGAYAVGAVLTKGALWAPHVVTVLALPRLAQGSKRALLIACTIVAASGLALVAAAWRAGPFAISLVGGDQYAELGPYAVGFAAVGALYAVVFVLVNAQIASRTRLPAVPVWVALAGFAVAVQLIHAPTLREILTLAVATALVATIAMAAVVRLHPPTTQ